MRFLLALLMVLFVGSYAKAFDTSLNSCDNPLDCAARSVVSLLPDWPEDFTRSEEPEGSGIILGDGTIIATADHVLGPAKSARVRTFSGVVMNAEIVLRDAATDIAFLKIENALKAIDWYAHFELPLPVSAGSKACAVGNSFGLDISITCGVISAKRVSGVGFNQIEDFLQTDASVNPGMSGGALVNDQGLLIGMLSAIFTRQSDANIGVNFAVSGELLYRVLADFQDDGSVVHRQPGILVRSNNPEISDGRIGAQVMQVKSPSIEETAGLKVGDIILKAGNRRIKRAGTYEAAIALAIPGLELDLVVLRDNELIRITLNPD